MSSHIAEAITRLFRAPTSLQKAGGLYELVSEWTRAAQAVRRATDHVASAALDGRLAAVRRGVPMTSPESMEARVTVALHTIAEYGNSDDDELQQWVLDGVVRILTDTPEGYELWVSRQSEIAHETDLVDGQREHRPWSTGCAP